MIEMHIEHSFHPVGQGLFASGSIGFRSKALPFPQYPSFHGGWNAAFRWVYDCGTNSPKRLVTNAIGKLKTKCDGEPIDLLTLSHFHSDHISGVVELLREIGARNILLPWAPLWHRLAIGFEQGFGDDDPEMQFFVDPVQYLASQAPGSFARVLFVMPSTGDGSPPSGGAASEPDLPEGPVGMVYDKEEFEVGISEVLELVPTIQENLQIDVLATAGVIRIAGQWEFVPYNDPDTTPTDPFDFANKVRISRKKLLRGDDSQRRTALSKLQKLYVDCFGKGGMNDVSLALYGGAVGEWCAHFRESRSPHSRMHASSSEQFSNRAAMLLTGDANLGNADKWCMLERYLDPRRATRTCLFQVPHHGSRGNSHDGLAQSASPWRSIFSSDPKHHYGHPHAEVLREFWSFNPIRVDIHTGFSIKVLLRR